MIGRGWVGTVATAAGVAAATGAAQLGFAYGLGVVSWLPGTGEVLPDDAWVGGLTWAVWIPAASVILGAVAADRLSGGADQGSAPGRGALGRLALGVAAAVGALVAVALIVVPAGAVELAAGTATATVAAGYAAAGVLAGVVMATLALTARAVAANLVIGFAWLWGFAGIAVVDRMVAGADEGWVPLGFWDLSATEPWYRNLLLPDAAPVLVAALLFGALTALPAARRGDGPVGVATSGAAGPVLLAAAWLLTQPPLVGAEPSALSRHLVVPYAVAAGLAGSLLATLVRPRSAPPASPTAPAPRPATDPAFEVEPAAAADSAAPADPATKTAPAG